MIVADGAARRTTGRRSGSTLTTRTPSDWQSGDFGESPGGSPPHPFTAVQEELLPKTRAGRVSCDDLAKLGCRARIIDHVPKDLVRRVVTLSKGYSGPECLLVVSNGEPGQDKLGDPTKHLHGRGRVADQSHHDCTIVPRPDLGWNKRNQCVYWGRWMTCHGLHHKGVGRACKVSKLVRPRLRRARQVQVVLRTMEDRCLWHVPRLPLLPVPGTRDV
jgi:hypothetical protein